MKKLNFNPNILTAGIAVALGFGIANTASAIITSGAVSPAAGSVSITNIATASYTVDGVKQPDVSSLPVVVNISETANFTLVATQNNPLDAINENQAIASPTGSVNFTNTLTNNGNVTDTYTIRLSDNSAGLISATDKFGYTNEDTTPITVKIVNADGTTASTTTITSGQTITLLPGQHADLSYNLTADGSGTGGDSGLATITAESQYIKAIDTTKATLTNEDQGIIKVPVFSIVKTAANNVDLNTATTIDYTIKVTNTTTAYSAIATNILVQDAIPAGLTLDTTTIKVSGMTDTSVTTSGSTGTMLKVGDLDLNVGETATITFTVKITDKAALATAGSVTNNADVYDNYDNSTPNPSAPQIYDSTSSSDPTKAKVQPTDDPNGSGTGGDTPATVSFQSRGLTLTGGATKELPTTSSPTAPATYTQTITNTGNQPESGLTFTISNPSTGDNITPKNVVYTAPDGTKTTLTPDTNGVYTIPGTIDPNKSGTISYDVVTTGATPNTSETNVVTLFPKQISGQAITSPAPVNNTTTVKDMSLVKLQALDADCNGTSDDGTFVATSITAKPTECVIYQITAKNNFTSKSLTNVVISDAASNWNTQATYVTGSIKDATSTGSTGAGTPVAPGTSAQSSSLTLAPNGTGTLTFSVKINQ